MRAPTTRRRETAGEREVKTTAAQSAEVAKRKTYVHVTADVAPSGGYAVGEATPDVLAQARVQIDAVADPQRIQAAVAKMLAGVPRSVGGAR